MNKYDVYINGLYYNTYESLQHLRWFLSDYITTPHFYKIEVRRHG